MNTEKQAIGWSPDMTTDWDIANKNPDLARRYSEYFDQRWPIATAQNLLTGLGLGAGATGLYHLVRHFTAKKPATAHTKFYGGPKNTEEAADNKEKKAADPVPAPVPQPPAGPSVWADERLLPQFLWGGLANTAGVPLAAMGGMYLMNKLVNRNKHKEYEKKIQDAQQEYESALQGKTAALASVYDANQEKIAANGWLDFLGKSVQDSGIGDVPYWSYINDALKRYNWYAGAAGGLSAALGGSVVYDITKQRSQAAAIRRAQEARARMAALPPMWITPEEIPAFKNRKAQNEIEEEPRKVASA